MTSRDRPAPQPSQTELFVCQRVQAELQPLLDGWREQVRDVTVSGRGFRHLPLAAGSQSHRAKESSSI